MSHEGNGVSTQRANRFRCGSPTCRRIITVFSPSHELTVRALLRCGWALLRDDGAGLCRWYCPRCKEDE